MNRLIHFDNEPIGTFIERDGEPPLLAPPIITVAGELRCGAELCLAIIETGATMPHVVYELATEQEFRSLVDRINRAGVSCGVEVVW